MDSMFPMVSATIFHFVFLCFHSISKVNNCSRGLTQFIRISANVSPVKIFPRKQFCTKFRLPGAWTKLPISPFPSRQMSKGRSLQTARHPSFLLQGITAETGHDFYTDPQIHTRSDQPSFGKAGRWAARHRGSQVIT